MEEKKVRIYYAKNKEEGDQLLELLKANGIEGCRQELGHGTYRDIYGGNSWYGEEILVDEQEEKQAEAVVQVFVAANSGKKKRRKKFLWF